MEWCLPRFNRGVATALTFIDTTQRHLQSYQNGRLVSVLGSDPFRQVELIVRGGVGLTGYRDVAMEPPAAPSPAEIAFAASEEPKL